MVSSMVFCTFLSAPIIFLSAEVISINKDFADQIQKFAFDVSIVALIAALWILLVFTVTKKYKRIPHKLTLCLNISQVKKSTLLFIKFYSLIIIIYISWFELSELRSLDNFSIKVNL